MSQLEGRTSSGGRCPRCGALTKLGQERCGRCGLQFPGPEARPSAVAMSSAGPQLNAGGANVLVPSHSRDTRRIAAGLFVLVGSIAVLVLSLVWGAKVRPGREPFPGIPIVTSTVTLPPYPIGVRETTHDLTREAALIEARFTVTALPTATTRITSTPSPPPPTSTPTFTAEPTVPPPATSTVAAPVPSWTPAPKPPPPPTNTRPAANRGVVLGIAGWAVSTVKVESRAQLGAPGAGGVHVPNGAYWLIWLRARNNTRQARSLASTVDFIVRDSKSAQYAELTYHGKNQQFAAIFSGLGAKKIDTPVPPGGEIQTILLYDMAAGTKPYQLIGRMLASNGRVLAQGQIRFDLTR